MTFKVRRPVLSGAVFVSTVFVTEKIVAGNRCGRRLFPRCGALLRGRGPKSKAEAKEAQHKHEIFLGSLDSIQS